jgi:hypothetical protein
MGRKEEQKEAAELYACRTLTTRETGVQAGLDMVVAKGEADVADTARAAMNRD